MRRAAEEDDREFLTALFARRTSAEAMWTAGSSRKQRLTLAMLRDAPRLYPGVPALIRLLKDHHRLRLAVVSGTWRGNVATVLEAAGLTGSIDLIVGKEDVKAVKPDPEAYRLALKRLKVAAKDAMALEDSPTGLTSARGAGLKVLAVGHRRPHGEWIGDATYLPDLARTTRVIQALGLDPPTGD